MYQKFQDLLNLHNISAYKVSKDTGVATASAFILLRIFAGISRFRYSHVLPVKFDLLTVLRTL